MSKRAWMVVLLIALAIVIYIYLGPMLPRLGGAASTAQVGGPGAGGVNPSDAFAASS